MYKVANAMGPEQVHSYFLTNRVRTQYSAQVDYANSRTAVCTVLVLYCISTSYLCYVLESQDEHFSLVLG